MRHLFVTQDFAPDLGGMARRHVELCRRFGDAEDTTMSVSTVAAEGATAFDSGESYAIMRQPFSFSSANRFVNQMRWGAWLMSPSANRYQVLHCGNVRPVGYAVQMAHQLRAVPYLVYVNGGDLLRERKKSRESATKRRTARMILGDAAGIVATSRWVSDLAREVMGEVGVERVPPVAAIGLGTDPVRFHPAADTGALRRRWEVGQAPLMITVARLVPHKGQDMGIRALALLSREFPDLRYILVGEGHDEQRLRALARELGVQDRVGFVGPMRDDELPEAYATATIYLGASRVDREVNAEGFGISFLEAAACGIPAVAGDSGGVSSAVRNAETGILVPPEDVVAISNAAGALLRDDARRAEMGRAARLAVESHFNWDRVASDTRDFTYEVIKREGARSV